MCDLLLIRDWIPLDLLGEFLSSLEFGDLLGLDLDLSTGLRIAAFAGSTLGNGECSETYEGNLATTFEGLGNGLDE